MNNRSYLSQDSLRLFTAASGSISALVELPDDTIHHLHSTVAPEQEKEYFYSTSAWGEIVLFAGVGLGYHIPAIMTSMKKGTTCIVVDYYDKCIDFCMTRYFADYSAPLFSLSATSNQETLQRIREHRRSKNKAQIQVIRHPASFDINQEFYDEIINKVFTSDTEEKKIPHKTLKVKKPLLLYGSFFVQEELRNAWATRNASDALIFRYDDCDSLPKYESLLQMNIQANRPDTIISVNMKGIDTYEICTTIAKREGISIVVWFVDDPHTILLPYKRITLSEIDAFCWERQYLPFLKECGFRSVKYLPLAADPAIFNRPVNNSPDIQCGFVGSSLGGTVLSRICSNLHLTDPLKRRAHLASELLMKEKSFSVTQALRQTGSLQELQTLDKRTITWLCAYIIHTASACKRINLLRDLLDTKIEIFGDAKEWKTLLGDYNHIHPPVDYRTGLCDLYHRIGIVVNSTSLQMKTALNQRLFDVPMSGSLVLCDDQSDLSELFKIGTEAIVYENSSDCREKIAFYKKNESARIAIIQSAKKRIISEHCYTHRLATIFSNFDHQ